MNRNNGPLTPRKAIFRKRKETLKKKAEELSSLCGVPVCLICYQPDGKIDTWPEDKKEVDDILMKYTREENINLQPAVGFLDAENNNQASVVIKNDNRKEKKEKKKKKVFETWDTRLDNLPEESLMDILTVLEEKEEILEERILQPKQIHEIKDFLLTARRKDAVLSRSSEAKMW
ncbi:hypothetical protein GH714_043441 [Hevea brasiliensis]|uniref:MADS-box domain-containing protein n=1 Tax=Hevea brasiliensis TaxID=3981 RepID=A0A6A6K396_HEVBR|nr:hypothetical protein GH714_043441 [Hevea brasiliensis]